MSLHLTPEMLEHAYEYLRASRPFRSWKLPHADEVGFFITRHKDRYGHMHGYKRSEEAEIAISELNIGSSVKLLEKMAHEMIHLYQHRQKTETPNTQHNAEYKRLARGVCNEHWFDYKDFV